MACFYRRLFSLLNCKFDFFIVDPTNDAKRKLVIGIKQKENKFVYRNSDSELPGEGPNRSPLWATGHPINEKKCAHLTVETDNSFEGKLLTRHCGNVMEVTLCQKYP